MHLRHGGGDTSPTWNGSAGADGLHRREGRLSGAYRAVSPGRAAFRRPTTRSTCRRQAGQPRPRRSGAQRGRRASLRVERGAVRTAEHRPDRRHLARRKEKSKQQADEQPADVAGPADARQEKVITRFRTSSRPTGRASPAPAAPSTDGAAATTKASPKRPKIAPDAPAAGLVGRGEDGQHAAARGAEQVDDEVLDVPVHLLDDRPEQVERVHVEGEVQHAQVEERAGIRCATTRPGDRPARRRLQPLTSGPPRRRGRRPVRRPGSVGEEDDHVDGDQRPGDDRRVGGVAAPRAVELAARREVVAGLLQKPGDAVGDRATLPGGARRSASR